jgi:hypothetical protein
MRPMPDGLVEDIRDAEREYKRGKAIFSKTWPFLSLEIDEADVDVARGLKFCTRAQSIGEIACGIRIGETALLQAKVADAEQRLGISVEPLMSNDVTWAQQVSVFTDVSGSTPRVVNLSFTPYMLSEVKIAVECQALNIPLTEVGTKDETAETDLDLTDARSGWDGLPMNDRCQPEDAGETAD